ncbi:MULTISPECIES: hypothetical protein [Streptomyces]|uniref:Uncharacterized protein n=1 Tax=Streptomyces fradiae ATCC 10745 = DSM 40063 TaxID=1319510 RepID=A0A1Y2P4Y2_STRFR|nr:MULTISPECIES: hypothetical protein [Streptomyces]KAF0646595.1 hypothetical protein K701_27995 [Streptomyces fradiae ATCC 10745 = DSM 40063]OSY54279.1 hypothetical protein BG846_00048 [Streptomyces fradiae ATCC 10745 = DSM 40063]
MGTMLLALSYLSAAAVLLLYAAAVVVYSRHVRDRLRAERRATVTARLTAAVDQRDAAAARRARTAHSAVLAEAEHIVDTAYATQQEGGHP